jgi:hypothetical protein
LPSLFDPVFFALSARRRIPESGEKRRGAAVVLGEDEAADGSIRGGGSEMETRPPLQHDGGELRKGERAMCEADEAAMGDPTGMRSGVQGGSSFLFRRKHRGAEWLRMQTEGRAGGENRRYQKNRARAAAAAQGAMHRSAEPVAPSLYSAWGQPRRGTCIE